MVFLTLFTPRFSKKKSWQSLQSARLTQNAVKNECDWLNLYLSGYDLLEDVASGTYTEELVINVQTHWTTVFLHF